MPRGVSFDDYATRYSCIRMRREHGILEMRFHTDGGPLRWGLLPHGELPDAFVDVARDRENRVVILTGTGDDFSGIRATTGDRILVQGTTANAYDRVHWEGRDLLMNLLNIEVPVIARHQRPGLAACRDSAAVATSSSPPTPRPSRTPRISPSGIVPGDGMHIVLPLLMGMNRGRYFLLTGPDARRAQEALSLGLVDEVLPPDQVLARAWEHAETLAASRPCSCATRG